MGNALAFLFDTVFGIYLLIVLLRFLLPFVRADYYNELSQFIVKATQPALRPLRRVIPGLAGVDVASLVLLFSLKLVQIWLLRLVGAGAVAAGLWGIVVVAIAQLLQLLVWVFLVSMIAVVIFSWVQPRGGNPAIDLLYRLADPVMRPFRRLVPSMGGIDISPIVPFLILGFLLQLLYGLEAFGARIR